MALDNRSLLVLAIAAAGMLTAVGCTTTTTEQPARAEPPVERVCLSASRLRSFDALSDSYVYVRESQDRHYLLTTRTRCYNLRNAITIALSDTTSIICSNSFAKILYQDRLSGRGLESCTIGRIDEVSSKEHAKAIVEARTGPPGKEEQGTWEELPTEGQE